MQLIPWKPRELADLTALGKVMKTQRFGIIRAFCWFGMAVIFAGWGCNTQPKPTVESSSGASAARVAPAFELPDAAGQKHRMDEFRGDVVVLHFWASWCPPCLDEFPELVEFARKWEGKRVKIVAVSLDQNWADAKKVLDRQKLPASFVSLLDVSSKIPELYGTFQFPESYLIGPKQTILAKWVGPQNWSDLKLQKALESAIGAR